jgi:S-layer protein
MPPALVFTGGSGDDSVRLGASTKATTMGAGDDTVILSAVLGANGTVAGGEGTDTVATTTALADSYDNSAQTVLTGFERLTLIDSAATTTIDLENLGFTDYVTTSGSTGTLTLDKMASDGTVVLTAAAAAIGGVTVNVAGADTEPDDDILNVALNSTGNLAAGLLTVDDVETVKISSTDTETGSNPTVNVNSLTLAADKATSISLSGGNDLTLTLTGSTAVTSINASSMTGDLTVTSVNTTSATTITGGSGDDVLVGAASGDTLLGGAGDDTLTAGNLTTLTGGEGDDTFITAVPTNVNSYSTITDFAIGDVIKTTGVQLKSAAISLAETAVFQDYANAAVNVNDADNALTWFQFGDNTYIVQDVNNADADFQNGTDMIIQLTGLVDLSDASFSTGNGTIELV